ncbi:MAG: hypothetical protein WC419_00860 [Candidatus Omnitrophota bacterium]|jgi:uncharacterized membrane protein|nr:hypothetical protein [Candidatus Omnitrophota bacterium]
MDSSILLARLIGPYIILIGVALIFNQKTFRKIIEDFPKNPSLVFMAGLFTFVAGLATVLFHNIWVADWRVIITVFGWLMLIKGVSLVMMPGILFKTTKVYSDNLKLVLIPWGIMILIGIFLVIKGYIIKVCY